MYAAGNPVKYNDPSGHAIVLPPCTWCDRDWIDYSQQADLAKFVIEGASTVGCLLAGCTVDYERDKIVGPTRHEYNEQLANSLMSAGINPIGMVKIPGLSSAKLTGIAERIIGKQEVADSVLQRITWMLTRRESYEDAVVAIEPRAMQMIASGVSERSAAEWAFTERNNLKLQFREGLSEKVLAIIENRQMGEYGNVVSKSLEEMYRQKGSWIGVIKPQQNQRGVM